MATHEAYARAIVGFDGRPGVMSMSHMRQTALSTASSTAWTRLLDGHGASMRRGLATGPAHAGN